VSLPTHSSVARAMGRNDAVTDRHPLVRLEVLALVGIGGFAGSNLRYFVARLEPGLAGTLVVNVLGSLALGFLMYEAIHADVLSGRTQTLLGSGFLSSFTTYSTFVVETVQSAPLVAVGYVAASYGLGFAGVLVGRALAVRLDAASRPGAGGEP
jgi:CrcB protein